MTEEKVIRMKIIDRIRNKIIKPIYIEKKSIYIQNLPHIVLPHLTLIEEFVYENLDAEKYVKEKFRKKGFLIEDMREAGNGHPDFIIKQINNTEIYLEVKKNKDGIRISQLKWLLENNDKNVIIYYLRILKEKRWIPSKQHYEIIDKNKIKKIKVWGDENEVISNAL